MIILVKRTLGDKSCISTHIFVFFPQSIQIDTIDRSIYGRLCTWSQTAEYGTSEIEPPRPVICPCGKKLNSFLASALISMEEIEPNLGRRVKFGGLLTLGIRRCVSSPFLLFVMYTRRRRIPSVSKRTHYERPATSGFRFNTEVYVDLDQGCDRRVESDFNTDSY